MKVVNVVGNDFLHTYYDVESVRVSEGCLIVEGCSETLGDWLECYTLHAIIHWSVMDQDKVN